MKRAAQLVVVVLAILCIPQVAQAGFITVGFQKVTNNNIEDLSGQLGLTIYDATEANSTFGSLALTGNQVLFVYTNNVGISGSLSEVYIDDETVVSLLGIHNLGGVTDFSGGSANPGNLPGGNTVSPLFVATSAFSADAQGNPLKGVDQAADILGISYSTLSGLAGIPSITSAIGDGSLRIGLHLRSIGVAGDSDSYLNTEGPTQLSSHTPEPSSLVLLSLGSLGLLGYNWRRKRKQAA